MEGDETVQSATRCNITLRPEPQESEETHEYATYKNPRQHKRTGLHPHR